MTLLSNAICWQSGLSFRPILGTQYIVTDLNGDRAKKMTGLKKTLFLNFTNSQYFFAKVSGIGPWVDKLMQRVLIRRNLYGRYAVQG